MNLIVAKSKVAGYYKLEALTPLPNGDVSVRQVSDWFPNIITNQGKNLIGSSSTYLTCCQVGSGNNTPSVSDTGLQSYVGGTSNITNASSASFSGATPPYNQATFVYTFGMGDATGNLQEIGIGTATTGSTLFSRALILDGGGSPTTVTVLSTEILRVTYATRIYPPTTDVTGSVTIAGVSYAYVLRASLINLATSQGWILNGLSAALNSIPGAIYDGTIGAKTSSPSGNTIGTTSATDASYSAGTYYRDGTIYFAISASLPSDALVTAATVTFNQVTYQISFTPGIPKDGTNQLSLTFRHAWDRF